MHEHDKKWVDEQIAKLPFRLQQSVRQRYAEVYQQAYDAEPVEHRKDGRARFAANTRLREYVEKVTKNNCTGEA
jgi:hypothetical protein